MLLKKTHIFIAALVMACGTPVGITPTALAQEHATPVQNGKVTGVVKDASGEPLIGATIMVKGTSHGTATDLDGRFALDAERGSTLIVSYIGLAQKEVKLNGETITIIMEEGPEILDEVVVTALGMKREKKALGYAVQDVKGDVLTASRAASLATSLNGKIAGMNISATSVPGGSNRIVIRGNNSISGNNMPLVVIDGVPFDNSQGVDDVNTNSWGTGFCDTGDGLSMLNPDDVESISVLKGPSATALYGSRGGNGVILVTTKQGKTGKVNVSYNSNLMLENVMMQPKLQNEWGQGTAGEFDLTSRNSWGPKMGTIVTDWTGQTRALSAVNNNYSDFMDTGLSWTNTLDVSGAAEKMNYRVGMSDTRRTGVFPNNKLNKTNLTLRAGGELIKNLTIDTKLSYTYQKGEGRPEFSVSSLNPIFSLLYTPRSINLHEMKDVFDDDGNLVDWYPWADPNKPPLTVINNPYAITQLTGNNDVTNRTNGFMSLTYQITDWLKGMIRFGGDTYSRKAERWMRHNLIFSAEYVNGHYSTGDVNMTEYNADFLVTAQKDNIKGSRISAMLSVGGNIMNRKYNSINIDCAGLSVPELYTVSNGMSVIYNSYKSEKEVQSLYALGQIAWDNYLFADVTVRNDWSSTLPSANRSFFYPSVSLSWIATDMLEKMSINVPEWITYGKLRLSYAEAGNDTDPYQLASTLSLVNTVPNGNVGVAEPTTKANETLKPEIIKSWEAGAELRFLQNRLGIDLTYYTKRAYNQIISMPSSITSGYTARHINAGRVDNHGIELQVTGTPIKTRKWNWDVYLNFAQNSSEVVELTEGVTSITLARPMGQNCFVMAKVGEPYGQIYTNGFKYNDKGEKLVGDNGKYVVDGELRCVGNFNPDWTAGLGSTVRYRNVSLGFMIDVRMGGDMYLQSMMRLEANGQTKETTIGREEYYTTGISEAFISKGVNATTGLPNTVQLDPTSYWGQFYGNLEKYIYDTSNIRLREINLTWQMPSAWFRGTVISGIKLSAVANNVCFIYNKLPGFDPECTYSTGNGQGIETASLPSTRTFGFNVGVTF